MANKMVTDSSANASFLNAAAATFPREVNPALKEVLSPFVGEGESMPDLTFLPLLIARLVTQRLERLIEADKANIDAQAELIEPRERRDGAFSHAYDTLYRIRDLCRGLYGPKETARVVPNDKRIPQRPYSPRWWSRRRSSFGGPAFSAERRFKIPIRPRFSENTSPSAQSARVFATTPDIWANQASFSGEASCSTG